MSNAGDPVLARIAAAKESERQRLAARQAEIRKHRPERRSKKSIDRAAYGTDKYELRCIRTHAFLVPMRKWARWIRIAALNWKQFPGRDCLIERPVPDQGAGYEAAARIFVMAMDGATVDEIESKLIAYREALGSWRDGCGTHYGDSELALGGYFRQLSRYFENGRWQPPSMTSVSTPKNRPTIDDMRRTGLMTLLSRAGRAGVEAEQCLLVLQAIERSNLEWIPAKELDKYGLNPNTVLHDCTKHGAQGSTKGGQGKATRMYSVQHLSDYVTTRWKPRNSKALQTLRKSMADPNIS